METKKGETESGIVMKPASVFKSLLMKIRAASALIMQDKKCLAGDQKNVNVI
jgi:hypothetical protein